MSKYRYVLVIIIILFIFTGCTVVVDKDFFTGHEVPKEQAMSEDNEESGILARTTGSEPIERTHEETTREEIDMIAEQIKTMSLEEKIGQMVIVGLEGYTPDDRARSMIEDYHVGGFIFFGLNVENAEQLLSLTNSLKSFNSKEKNSVPLFLSIDEEGGRVSRVPNELMKLPTSKEIGDVNNPDFSYQVGGLLADIVKAFGFNLNYAPVLDINSNPENPVIGDRSFGDNADVVSTLGVATMKGMQDSGVVPVVKHFPGHGDTHVDSHVGLPSVDHSMERLQSFELKPFQDAVERGADAVMIAHIQMTEIDPENPSSLSKAVITDLLRDKMGFKGVVITDDLTMGAIKENVDISEAAVQSVNAGVDIVLVCHGYDNEVAVLDALKVAVDTGEISEERINESVYRIFQLKYKYQMSDQIIPSVNVEDINRDISQVLNMYMSREE